MALYFNRTPKVSEDLQSVTAFNRAVVKRVWVAEKAIDVPVGSGASLRTEASRTWLRPSELAANPGPAWLADPAKAQAKLFAPGAPPRILELRTAVQTAVIAGSAASRAGR